MADKLLLGAVGEKDAVLAFRSVGVRAVPTLTAQETASAIHRLYREGVRVIFITEAAARLAPEMIERFSDDPQLAIIPIPGTTGTDGYGEAQVRANVLKAIGAELTFDNE